MLSHPTRLFFHTPFEWSFPVKSDNLVSSFPETTQGPSGFTGTGEVGEEHRDPGGREQLPAALQLTKPAGEASSHAGQGWGDGWLYGLWLPGLC